jgi:hypothetical protein
MFVYHSSNVKIGVLRVGSYVTPDAEISKTFGRSKPGKIHYCHEFEAEVRDYSIVNIGGRTIIDVTAKPVGQLERSPTPTGEDWENYVTTSELRPISIIEY